MSWLKSFAAKFKRRDVQGDLTDELRFHLDKEIELNIVRGMSAEEARRRALIAFGGVQQTRENVRQARWSHWIEIFLQDLRYGARMLRRSPGVTAIAVVTLALGIGMNTAIFSLIDAVLFRALPASHPEELVVLRWQARHRPKLDSHSSYGDCRANFSENNSSGCSLSLPFFRVVRSQDAFFAGTAAFTGAGRLDLSGNGAATILNSGQLVSGEYFRTLGIGAALGRMIGPEDDAPTAPAVAVLRYGYWQSAFGGSPDAVGRVIKINGLPTTIIGVAEPSFAGLAAGQQFDVWLPMSLRPQLIPIWNAARGQLAPHADDGRSWWLVIVARLKPGVSVQQAQAALSVLFRDQVFHEQKAIFTAADEPGLDLLPAEQGLEGGRRQLLSALYVLMLAAGLVLLIACANIAGLLLARAAARSREIAVRLVLGAKRHRLISQLLVESLLLSLMGGTLGQMLAHWTAKGLMRMTAGAGSGPQAFTPHLDVRVLAFTTASTILTGLFFGLAPAMRSLRVDLTPALKSGDGAASASHSRSKWYSMGNMLVVAQMALAVVALVTAGLLLRTLGNLKNINIGFDARNVLVFGLDPALAGYKRSQLAPLYRDLQEQVAVLPGVISVSYSWNPLLGGGYSAREVHLRGTPETARVDVDYMPIGPGFLETMRIPLQVGREFSPVDFSVAAALASRPSDAPPDPQAAPRPAIVNETFVHRFFPHESPLGARVENPLPEDVGKGSTSGQSKPRDPGWEIVGVVSDAKYANLRREIKPTLYVVAAGDGFFSLRTAGDPLLMVPAIRDIINRKDNNLAMFRVATEAQQIDNLVFAERLVARLSTAFGLLAVVLACIGLYGLLAYEVTRRTREIGIRMAIGAQQSDVVGMVVRQGLLLAVVGAVTGGIASIGVKGLLQSMLYQVQLGDPITLAAVAGLLLLVALAACYVPARRATRIDPLVALRYE